MVRVKKIAEQVRKAFDEISRTDNPGYKEHSLCGYCCRASAQVFLAAQRQGIKGVQMVLGNGHVFNVFDGQIVDVTATQFGVSSPVHIAPYKKENPDKNCWQTVQGPFDSFEKFVKEAWSVDPSADLQVVLRYEEDPFNEYPYCEETV